MNQEALVKAIADKTTEQVKKMPGSLNGLTIVTASPLVKGKTFFLHKVLEVDSSNFINNPNDLITQIDKKETSNFNHSEFVRAFLTADTYLFVRFSEMEIIEFIQKM